MAAAMASATTAEVAVQTSAAAATASATATAQGADRVLFCYHYLVTAVRVHPAVNQDEDTTEAFIHAARCWLQSMRAGADGSLPFSSPQSLPDPDLVNIDMAYMAFECATTECLNYQPSPLVGFAKGKLFSCAEHEELAHILNEAQRLVRIRQESDAWASMRSAASGLVLSAGLFACGAAESHTGWHILGSLTRRVAMFQGMGHCAAGSMAALQHPSVREQVEEPLRTSIQSNYRTCLSGLSNCFTAGLDKRENVEEQLTVGCLVTITGLHTALELNGRDAEVLGVDEETGRYKVCIVSSEGDMECHQNAGATVKLIKADNLLRRRRPLKEAPATVEQFI